MKEIVRFPPVAEDSFPKKQGEQLDLIGEGMLNLPSAEFMRKNL